MPPKPYVTGRPTKYTDEMPELLREAMYNGLSVIRFCRQVRISKDTFYNWIKEYPEFSDAFALGKTDCEGWWEEYATENMENKSLNTNLLKYYMANRFGWSDNKFQNQQPQEPKQEQFTEELKALVAKYQKEI